MLKSLYSYKGNHSRTLSFTKDEKFVEIGISKDPSWVHVINEHGIMGYIPKNYVAFDESSPHDMIRLIDEIIESIHKKAGTNGGSYSQIEREALGSMAHQRQLWRNKIPPMHSSKRPAPPPPKVLSCDESTDMHTNCEKSTLPHSSSADSFLDSLKGPVQETHSSINDFNRDIITSFVYKDKSFEPDSGGGLLGHDERNYPFGEENFTSLPADSKSLTALIPANYYKHLVDLVRSNTNISISTSHQVVTLVLQSLGNVFNSLNPLVNEILQLEGGENSVDDVGRWEASSDGRKIVELLEKLRQCKDDRQQRSWALYEDELVIKLLLQDILEVITNGDTDACNCVLGLDDHRALLILVQYYQMEARWTLRKILLEIFTGVCHLSPKNISYLSASVLPLEMTREILDPKLNEDKLQYICLVLSMILSMADTLPVIHFGIMNDSFVRKLFDSVEFYCSEPEMEEIGDVVLTLILAFNLQFCPKSSNQCSHDCTENIVMKVLSQQKQTKYFVEKILILFNREEDPVQIFNHSPVPPNSVLCLIRDMFRDQITAKLLYTNDEKVLCDILLRQITDLPPEDTRRKEYLLLLDSVVSNGRWMEHKHRQADFLLRLSSISSTDDSFTDKILISKIVQNIK